MTVIEGIISRFVAGDNPGYPADTPASKKGLYYDQRTNMFICTYSDSVRVTVVSMLSFPRETARCKSPDFIRKFKSGIGFEHRLQESLGR